MPTSYTTLLGLALPVQGELQGTWGDEVNNYITNYLDASVAGTQTLSTDADVTLTKTTGTALGATSSQYLILNCTGSRAAARNITVPAQSKAYVVINGTTGGFAVTLRGAGPTTGVSIAAGERAVCVWNGSDFVKAASSNGSPGGSTTQVQYNNAGALAGSANLTFDGTSLTLGGNPTLSAGTANGVAYLNGSKVLTSGSALTFDGTDLATTGGVRLNNAQYYYGKNAAGSAVRLLGVNAGNVNYVGSIDSGPTEVNYGAATTITAQYWNISGSEQMRLTSTGLGIGTSSPGYKLQVASAGSVAEIVASNSAGSERIHLLSRSSAGVSYVQSQNSQLLVGTYDNYVMQFMTNNTTRMLLDTSGNLGIGTSSPQAKLDVQGNISLINNYRVGYNLATETLTVSGVTTPNYGIAMGSYTGFGGPGLGVSGYYGVLFATNGTERMRLDSSGNLLVGTASAYRSGRLVVKDVNRTQTSTTANLHVSTTDAYGADIGGSIGLGGKVSGDETPFVYLSGRKSTSSTDFAGYFAVAVQDGAGGTAERMRLDSSGNLGLGVTPSAWGSGIKSVQVGNYSALTNSQGGYTWLSNNAFYDTAWKYLTTNRALYYAQDTGDGGHKWYTAPSGTAGNAITFTQAMTLDASGNLGVGTTSPSSFGKLAVTGSLATTYINDQGIALVFTRTGDNYVNASNGNLNYNAGVHVWTNSAQTTEYARIDSSGNLGVGTTSPSSVLSLARGSGVNAYIEVAGNGNTVGVTSALFGQNGSSVAYCWNRANAELLFGTNGTERARITSGGDLLVGTTDSSQTSGSGFKVGGAAGAGVGQVAVVDADSTNSTVTYRLYSTGAAAYRFYVGLGGTVYATNTTITGISDVRLKENIRDLDDGLGMIMALKPRKFDWKAGKGKDIKGDRGFIAQEFEQVFPDLIDEWKDPAPEGEAPYKAVRADLIPVLVKAIQELTARVAQLERQA